MRASSTRFTTDRHHPNSASRKLAKGSPQEHWRHMNAPLTDAPIAPQPASTRMRASSTRFTTDRHHPNSASRKLAKGTPQEHWRHMNAPLTDAPIAPQPASTRMRASSTRFTTDRQNPNSASRKLAKGSPQEHWRRMNAPLTDASIAPQPASTRMRASSTNLTADLHHENTRTASQRK